MRQSNNPHTSLRAQRSNPDKNGLPRQAFDLHRNDRKNNRSGEAGNVFVLILLGIVLFVALSLSISRGMRSDTTNNLSKQEAALAASDILAYAQKVERAVNRLRRNGVSESDIDFQTDYSGTGIYLLEDGNYNCWNNNANCTSDACKVFHPDGCNISPTRFENLAQLPSGYPAAWTKPGHITIRQISIQGIGTSAPDLALNISSLNPLVCNEINRKMGISTDFTTTSTTVEPTATSRPEPFGGCGGGGIFNTTNILGDEDTRFEGATAFCAPIESVAGTLHFYYIILVR